MLPGTASPNDDVSQGRNRMKNLHSCVMEAERQSGPRAAAPW